MTAEEAKQRIAARDAAKQAAAETEIEKKKAELATMQSRVQEQLPTYLSYAYSAIAKAIDCGVDIERDGVSFGCGCDEEGDYIAAQLSEALRKDGYVAHTVSKYFNTTEDGYPDGPFHYYINISWVP